MARNPKNSPTLVIFLSPTISQALTGRIDCSVPMTTIVVGNRHVPLSEVCLISTRTLTRAYAVVSVDPTAFAGLAKTAADLQSSLPPPLPERPGSSSPATLLPRSHVRAALFARIVHASQGRSGLRPEIIEFFAALLNEQVESLELPANGAALGFALLDLVSGVALAPALAAELSAKGVALPLREGSPPLSGAEVGALVLGSGALALTGGGALVVGAAAQAAGSVDYVAALTAAAKGVPAELKDDSAFELKPNRAVAASAYTFKTLLRDSPHCDTASPLLCELPQVRKKERLKGVVLCIV